MKFDFYRILGFIFCVMGLYVIIRNHKLSLDYQNIYKNKGPKNEKKLVYILFYIRGMIVASLGLIVGIYFLFWY